MMIDALGLMRFLERSRSLGWPTVVSRPHDAPQGCNKIRTGGPQFISMMERQFRKHSFSPCCKGQQHLAAIVPRAGAMDKSSSFQAVYQLYGAVMADLHTIRQFRIRGRTPSGIPLIANISWYWPRSKPACLTTCSLK